MFVRAAILLALAALLACAGPQRHPSPPAPAQPTLAAAEAAYAAYDLLTSRTRYRELLAATGSSRADRLAAHRALARYAWQYDQDWTAACAELEQARRVTDAPSAVWAQQAEIELGARRLPSAQQSAERALASAASDSERVQAQLTAGRVLLAVGGPAELARAAELLRAVLELRPGHVQASEALLGAALGLEDGPGVVAAWRSYFWIADGAQVPAVLRQAHATLAELAPRWRGRPLSEADRRKLALALAQSRFFAQAAKLARGLRAQDSEVAELLAYQAFLERVAAVNADFYPRIARGLRGYDDGYEAAIHQAARPLWEALRSSPFDPDAFFALIRERFGAEGYIGTTVGFTGMLMGHVIHDETRQVVQYGHAGEFRYLMIDRGVSTDFTSWYGTTNVGGWGDATTMVQVRAAYTAEPFNRLAWVTDPSARSALEEQIARLRKEDLDRCGRDPYAQPASLSLALRLAASERIYARLKASGLKGDALALAFVAESLRLNVEATVFAHEGRHALDQRHFAKAFAAMSDDERELRAKLSEVAFASDPKLALTGSVIGGALDESTGHGRANRRFRGLLVDWMQAHRSEIAGLDPQVPLILQVERLSDEQLRQLVREADPMSQLRPTAR